MGDESGKTKAILDAFDEMHRMFVPRFPAETPRDFVWMRFHPAPSDQVARFWREKWNELVRIHAGM